MAPAKETMMWILAVSLSITLVNALGIFSPVAEMNVGVLGDVNTSQEISPGVTEISDGITSDSDIADKVSGTSLLLSMGGTLMTLLQLLVLPYPYLVNNWSFPWYIAAPIQIILNVSLGWYLIWFWTGRQAAA